MILENRFLRVAIDLEQGGLLWIKNRATGDRWVFEAESFSLQIDDHTVRREDCAITGSDDADGQPRLLFVGGGVEIAVRYFLYPEIPFVEKQISLRAQKDLGLAKVVLSSCRVHGDHHSCSVHRYPKFDIIEKQVEHDYHWGITRELGTEPAATVFLRSEAGGLALGARACFGETLFRDPELSLAVLPAIKLPAGASLALEPAYFGVYQRGARDVHKDEWTFAEAAFLDHGNIGADGDAAMGDNAKHLHSGQAAAEQAVLDKRDLLPAESALMLRLTETVLPPRNRVFKATLCGWHSQFCKQAYTPETVRADIEQLSLLKQVGIDCITQGGPWSGELQRMNAMTAADTWSPTPLEREFCRQAAAIGISVMQWTTITNTYPWDSEGRPFCASEVAWLRDTGNAPAGWPMHFQGMPGNCLGSEGFVQWLDRQLAAVMESGLFDAWSADGDFWGTGGYFHSTVPVTCRSDNHGHLPGRSDYLCVQNFIRLAQRIRERRPEVYIAALRPLMDYGPWAMQPFDVCFAPIETGTGNDNVKGGDEIRSACRMRVHHEFMPHYLNWPLLFPSYANDNGLAQWPDQNLDYIMMSAISCSPNILMYLPAAKGLTADQIAPLRRWIDWSREHQEFLFVRRDLLDWPGKGKVDGSAHVLGDRAFLFLFNGTNGALDGHFVLSRDELGDLQEGDYTIRQEFPAAGTARSARYGDRVTWAVPARSAVLLKLEKTVGTTTANTASAATTEKIT